MFLIRDELRPTNIICMRTIHFKEAPGESRAPEVRFHSSPKVSAESLRSYSHRETMIERLDEIREPPTTSVESVYEHMCATHF